MGRNLVRDGKRRREKRGTEPSYLLDSNGKRQNPPKLGDIPISFEPAEKGANLDFFLEWEGVRHRFHSTMHCQPGNIKHTDMLYLQAAIKLGFVAFGLKEVQPNKQIRERDMVKFLFKFWRYSNDWNGVMEEAHNYIECRKVMES
jgi:hypothetical protein